MARELIGLDEFMDWSGEAQGVEIESHFYVPPYAPAEDIGVDVNKIAAIARLGRISGLRIGTCSEENTVSYSATNVNSDGSATMGAVKADTVARSRTSLNERDESNAATLWPRGKYTVQINTNHPDMRDRVLRDPQPWANLFNKGIGNGLKAASKTQLMEPRAERTMKFARHNLTDLAYGFSLSLAFQDPGYVALVLATRPFAEVLGVFSTLNNLMRMRRGQEPVDDEQSLVYHYPVDRLLAVKAMASTAKLVKVNRK